MVLADAFNGVEVFSNVVRLFVIFVGITLGLVCVRLGYMAFRRGQRERMWGILSFGCLVLNPAISGLYRFGQPILWPATGTYAVGLALGLVGLAYRVALSPPWKRARRVWKTRAELRRTAERDKEDRERSGARHREDVALVDDRLREDNIVTTHRGREDDGEEPRR